MLDAAKGAPAGAACWMQKGEHRPGDGVEAGVDRGRRGGWGVGRGGGVDPGVGRREASVGVRWIRASGRQANTGAAGWMQGAGT